MEELKEWLSSNYVTSEDVGKNAVILGAELKESKFGTKLYIRLELNGTEQKELVLGKNLSKILSQKIGMDIKTWIGKRGKIQIMTQNVQGKGLVEKAIFIPA